MSSPAALGMKISNHVCPLKFYSYDEKLNPGYSGGFSCSVCVKNFNKSIPNFHCTKCEYDICEKCLYSEINREINSSK